MSVGCRPLLARVSAGSRLLVWQKIPNQRHLVRGFLGSPHRSTDGVYKELTEMRIRTPWIDALKRKRQEEQDPSKTSESPVTLPGRDLGPKKMSDSFTRIVRMMWGHIFSL